MSKINNFSYFLSIFLDKSGKNIEKLEINASLNGGSKNCPPPQKKGGGGLSKVYVPRFEIIARDFENSKFLKSSKNLNAGRMSKIA